MILSIPTVSKKINQPLSPPKVVPGYLNDLLSRMASEEELPRPDGEPQSSKYTVRWQATREAELLNDPAFLSQAAVKVEQIATADEFHNLSFVLVWFIKNTKSRQGEKLLARLLERIPNKKKFLQPVFWSLDKAPTLGVRKFALKHLPNNDWNDWDIEGNALHVLKAAANPKDFGLLSKLLMSGRLHDGNLPLCVEALIAVGGKRAVKVLGQFAEENQKDRAKWVKEAVGRARYFIEYGTSDVDPLPL